MNDEISPSPLNLPPEEAALEGRLRQLRPRLPRAGLREEILDPLSLPDGDHEAVARDLKASLHAAPLPPHLWDRIDSQLQEPAHQDAPESSGNIVSLPLPQWSDFAPLFRVAAAVAIGVFLAAVWLRPDGSGSRDQVVGATPASPPPPVMSHRLGKMVPVSRHGFIQGMESRGVVTRNNQLYETHWQKRKDHTVYQFDGDLQVEDEVSREGLVETPLHTF